MGHGGVEYGMPDPGSSGVLVNETGLPDQAVHDAVATFMEESGIFGQGDSGGSLNFGNNALSYQSWPQMQGNSMMARRGPFRPPWNTFEEIKYAREMAERDDDIGSAIGAMIALAFRDEAQQAAEDEVTQAIFEQMAEDSRIDQAMKNIYWEYLIAGQFTTVSLFTRDNISFTPDGTDRQRTRNMVIPRIGLIPAEQIRVVDSDLFPGEGTLAYFPEDEKIQMWLRERFNPSTSAARLAEMRREDPVSFALFTGPVQMPWEASDNYTSGQIVYTLNPRMAARTSMPKGAWKYPRPPLTRNFPLLEAKRLLNIMDHALLAGGANFLVVAKKGSNERPALPAEVANLRDVIKRASQTGVIVGDHRIDIQIITPELKELLNAEKRSMLARRLTRALMRLPEFAEMGGGQATETSDVEIATAVIESDRRDIVSHIKRSIYAEVMKRNAGMNGKPPDLWHPKIILQGTQYFNDYILKARDRGDISRKAAVEAGGFNYRAQVAQRKREKAAGDDRVMTPGQVPFSSPNAGPQDNNEGRPRGSSAGNGRNGPQPSSPAQARPSRPVQRNAGETVRAIFDEEQARVFRVGDLTEQIMEDYAETLHFGRVSSIEHQAIESGETTQRGPRVVVPIETEDELSDFQAVRLDDDTAIIVGTRGYDGAKLTAALSFKAPRWDVPHAEDQAIAWGFRPTIANPEHEESPVDN